MYLEEENRVPVELDLLEDLASLSIRIRFVRAGLETVIDLWLLDQEDIRRLVLGARVG